MGWCTELFCNIYFNKETYNHISQVEDKIEECEAGIKLCKNTIRKLAYMTEPNKFYNKEDYNSANDFIEQELSYSLNALEEYYYDLYKLELLKDNWDACHNKEGLAINPPEEINWNTAYLQGDFVKSIKYPNANE